MQAADLVRNRLCRRQLTGGFCGLLLCISGGALAESPGRTDDELRISAAVADEHGVQMHTVQSPFQAGTTKIRVLLPPGVSPGRPTGTKRLPVVYVLPVEAKDGQRYGDGLTEIRRKRLHQRYPAIYVAPTFSHLPWYADHPTAADIRQESYFLEVVIPHVEQVYPADASREGRRLLGFSKSGWGAWTLLLRYPDVFEKAAAWDAPLMMEKIGRYGNREIFGTQENFVRYRPMDLLRLRAKELEGATRLIIAGYGSFRSEHLQMRALLQDLAIPHVWRDGPQRKHEWHSGWVGEVLPLLLAD